MALSIVLVVMIISTTAVCFIVIRQNRDVSHKLIRNAFSIASEVLSELSRNLVYDTRQMTVINSMTSEIKYLVEFGSRSKEVAMSRTYHNTSQGLYTIAIGGNIWKAAAYNLNGELLVFAGHDNQKGFLGYAHRGKDKITKGGLVDSAEDLKKTDLYQPIDKIPAGILPKLQQVPTKEVVDIVVVDGFLCLVAYEPVIAEVYVKASDALEKKQIAIVKTVKKIDKQVASRIAKFSGSQINIFANDTLSVGNNKAYAKLDISEIKKKNAQWKLDGKTILINDINLNKDSYFQGIMPLYGNSEYVGAVVALYSKAIAKANTWQMIKLLTLISVACILLIIPFIWFFSNRMSKPIKEAIEGLVEVSDQVGSGASQVATGSMRMAESASEQAASLEETSSSLEEMSSMTNQNAENATSAEKITKNTNQVIGSANGSMEKLVVSMDNISQASEETSKIIKTIDEIAFQTNLLALNAAVEAARAGEAGAGFAVVADEVRNLALRAAEAAKNTSALIERTVNTVNDGSGILSETNQSFSGVAESSQKVAVLIGDIAAASSEQAHGIQQVKEAIMEMNKVTQESAANAEESSASSEEMNAQAEYLRKIVQDLSSLIEGEGTDGAIVKQAHKTKKAPASRRVNRSGKKTRADVISSSKTPLLSDPGVNAEDNFEDF